MCCALAQSFLFFAFSPSVRTNPFFFVCIVIPIFFPVLPMRRVAGAPWIFCTFGFFLFVLSSFLQRACLSILQGKPISFPLDDIQNFLLGDVKSTWAKWESFLPMLPFFLSSSSIVSISKSFFKTPLSRLLHSSLHPRYDFFHPYTGKTGTVPSPPPRS